MDLSEPRIMGILNVTPDSFYDGGQFYTDEDILQQTEKLMTEGADILDVGAYSSRPGAENIAVKDEIERLDKALTVIRNKFPDILISIDTFRAEVAAWAVENYGANMINDISAGQLDKDMFATIARLQVPYAIMHMKGNPQNMQQQIQYQHFLKDIIKYFAHAVQDLKQMGVNDIIIDPGFGFSKTLDQNYRLMSCLDDLKIFELPILVGVSRKSMVYKLLHVSKSEALNGTTALNMLALTKGANMLRVHDVKAAKEAITIYQKCLEMEKSGYQHVSEGKNEASKY